MTYDSPPGDVAIGTGMRPGARQNSHAGFHIFERFWRADKVLGREAGGTGLGLTIARQIAAARASLTVASHVGRGSLFAVRLPVGC